MATRSPPAAPPDSPPGRSDTENPVFEPAEQGPTGGGGFGLAGWVPTELKVTDLGLVRSLGTYKTVKFQVVEEPLLALIAWSIKVAVLVYVFVLMTHYHTYNAKVAPASVLNAWGGSRCTDDVPPVCTYTGQDEPFCSGTGPAGADYVCAEGWEYLDNSCRDHLMGEVVRKSPSLIEIVTYATTVTKATDGLEARANYFTPHVDMVPVTFQYHWMVTDESGDGFDDFRPGPHYSRTILYDADGNVFKELQPPADGTAITATLSVAEWLQLAGIPSIDEPNDGAVNSCSADADRPLWAPDRVPAFRLTGVELDIHIITTNEVLGISTMGATQPVTEVRVKRGGGDWTSFGSLVSYLSSYPTEVVDAYQYGVRLNFITSGQIVAFDFSVLMNSVTTYLVMLGFATVVGDFALSFLFGQKSKVYKDAKNDLLDANEIEQEHKYKVAMLARKQRDRALGVFDKHMEAAATVDNTDAPGTTSMEILETIVLDLEEENLHRMHKKDRKLFDETLSKIVEQIEDEYGQLSRQRFADWWMAREESDEL